VQSPRRNRANVLESTALHFPSPTRSLRLHPLTAFVALALAAGATGGVGASAPGATRATLAARHGHAPRSFAGAVPPAPLGVTRAVQNCNDSGSGSLREAYFLAGDQDTVDLGQLACSHITLTTGALSPPVNAPASVTLLGPASKQFVIDGSGIDSVLIHRGTGTLLINHLTITNGKHLGAYGGGCIYSAGTVALIASTVSGCRLTSTGNSVARGGAIFAKVDVSLLFSSVTGSTVYSPGSHSAGGGIYARKASLIRSAVSGNTASSAPSYALGGGVFTTSSLYAQSSTISGNSASEGAAAFGDSALIIDSTISGNDAFAVGGVYARSYAQVYNSTIVKNTSFLSDYAAGLFVATANSITLQSSIVALNSIDATVVDIGASGAATTIVGANNLITAVAAGITVAGGTIVADPQIGPLGDNGGPTQTHALRWNSPAIDHGNNLRPLDFDQRGIERVKGASADIGAFEFVEAIFGNNFDPEIN
jgi:hypothetical protein